MSVGERISELRKAKNLSQGQLADAVGISRQAVSKWENDLSSPDTIHLIQLAETLDTEVEYLATGRKPVYEEPPIVLNMVQKVDRVIEKVVEKPVIRRVIRIKYLRNPLEFAVFGLLCFFLGLAIGKFL
ncbi:MAG: helix-turn-helix domain-containing protein [Faecousia sp.]